MNIKRVVLDTNVIVSASLSRDGKPANIYRMFLAGKLTLVYCEEILAEYEDVLYRPHLKIPINDADIVIAAVRQHGEKVTIVRVQPPCWTKMTVYFTILQKSLERI